MENENSMDRETLLKQFANILDLYGDDITRREYDDLPTKPVHSRTLEMKMGGWNAAKVQARDLYPKAEHVAEELPSIESPTAKKAVRLLKKQPYLFENLCDALELPPKKTREILREIEDAFGNFLTQVGEAWTIEDPLAQGPEDLVFAIRELKYGRFGITSDKHFGSRYQQLSHLNDFYEKCYNVGVDFIIDMGDLTDGDGTVYRGQRFEMFLHGFAEMRDYVVEHHPRIDGIETWVIAGNHDESFIKSANVNVLEEIALRRNDIVYLGRRGAYVNLTPKAVKAYLHHPSGGVAYAISYKPQKFIEGFASENKPQVYFIGHYHTMGQFFIRNVHTFLSGCFQAQTPYLRDKGMMPQIGGWIVDFDVATDGWSLEMVNSTVVPYYKPIKDDYKNYPR